MENRFHTTIPPVELQKALDFFKQGAAILLPFLLALTPEEREHMLKMADKTVAFVQKAFDYATANPAFQPAFVDMSGFGQDLDGVNGLASVEKALFGLALDVESTRMVAGSEAYAAALSIYNYIKYLAANNQPGAQAAYDDLAKRFPGNTGGRPPKPLGDK